MDWGKIRENLVLVALTGIFAIVTGWLFGTSQIAQIESKLDTLLKTVADLKTREDSHDRFANCAAIRLALIEQGAKKPPPCAEGDLR